MQLTLNFKLKVTHIKEENRCSTHYFRLCNKERKKNHQICRPQLFIFISLDNFLVYLQHYNDIQITGQQS